MAKSLFRGGTNYSKSRALSVPLKELERLGLDHAVITAAQRRAYTKFAGSGNLLTLEGAASIEVKVLVKAGLDPKTAKALVKAALDDVVRMGVSAPSNIPWNGPIL